MNGLILMACIKKYSAIKGNSNIIFDMDEIEVISSEEADQDYSETSYHQENIIQYQEEYHLLQAEQVILTNKPEVIISDEPSYQEIQKIIQAIKDKYPERCLKDLIEALYQQKWSQQKKKRIVFDSAEQKERYSMQCRYAAKSFVELQYGINRMRKMIAHDLVDLQISSKEYNDIIQRIFYASFKRLQDFISQKCHSSFKKNTKNTKNTKILSNFDLRGLIETIRLCRKLLSSEDVHNLFKIIMSTFNQSRLKLSKKQAIRLYKSLFKHINGRKRRGLAQSKKTTSMNTKEEGQQYSQASNIYILDLQNEDLLQDIDIQQEFRTEFEQNEEIASNLIDQYIKWPNSMADLSSLLKNKYSEVENTGIFQEQVIKGQIQDIIMQTIKRIQEQTELPQYIEQGVKFKKLVPLNEESINMILQSEQAGSLRATLCQYYKLTTFDINTLICTILQINGFVNKVEHEKIIKSLRITKEENSICRQEYEFAGKRRKVLVYKRKRPPKNRPFREFF